MFKINQFIVGIETTFKTHRKLIVVYKLVAVP